MWAAIPNPRAALVARAEHQRQIVACCVEPWRIPLSVADRGIDTLQSLRRHPILILSGVGLFAALRPGRVGKWLRRGWLAWQILQKLRPAGHPNH
jgi:hypothetical protein